MGFKQRRFLASNTITANQIGAPANQIDAPANQTDAPADIPAGIATGSTTPVQQPPASPSLTLGEPNSANHSDLGSASQEVCPNREGIRAGQIVLDGHVLAVLSVPAYDPELLDKLSPVEKYVAQRIQQGDTDKEIAAQRHRSPQTIMNQTQSVYGKVGAWTRPQLAQRLVSDCIEPKDKSGV